MKITTCIWVFLKRNWDVITTMVIAAVIAPLGYLQKVEPQIVSAAILSVLFLIACSLLVNRETNNRLQQITKKIWERIYKPSIDEILVPYNSWMEEIKQNLVSAREVWILSRTCARFWHDYEEQLLEIFNRNGSIRLLLVDPSNGALRMIANSVRLVPGLADNRSDLQLTVLRAQVNDFVRDIADLRRRRVGEGCLALRMIDYLPAHTLVILNGNSEQGVIFVELGTFQSGSRDRPTFCLLKTKDEQLFTLYHKEYQIMWDRARPDCSDSAG